MVVVAAVTVVVGLGGVWLKCGGGCGGVRRVRDLSVVVVVVVVVVVMVLVV